MTTTKAPEQVKPALPSVRLNYDGVFGPANDRIFSVRRNQFCCGLMEIGNISINNHNAAFECFNKECERLFKNLVFEVILPIETIDKNDDLFHNYLKMVNSVVQHGFVPYGDTWFNPNSGHTLQAYRRFPK